MNHRRLSKRWLPHATAVVLGLLSGCGDGATVLDPDDMYVPNFTFVWDEINAAGAFVDPVHRFTLLTDQSGQQAGTINDQSSEELNGQRNVVTGTFRNHDLNLTVDRSGSRVTITGRFLTDDTIQFQEPSRTYTVRRNRDL